MKNILASLVCIVLSYRVIAISLRSGGSGIVTGSMLEMAATRWKSCSSCIMKKSSSPEDIKLQLQDLKDNVDFHMNNFTKSIKEKLDIIKETIDPTELEHLKEACEQVEDKIKETQSDIKGKCDILGEAMESKQNNQTYGEIVKRVENYKKLIKKFVDEGLESLNDDLNKIKQEFATNQTTEKNSNENINKNDDKDWAVEKASDHYNMPQNVTDEAKSSLVQMTSHEVEEHDYDRRKRSAKRREGTKSTDGDNKRVDKSSNEKHDMHRDEEGEKYQHGDEENHEDKEHTNKKESENLVKEEQPQQKDGEERGVGNGNSLNTNKDKSYDVKSKSDKASTTFKMSQETQEAFEFSHIPPTAITRAVKMYLQDLNTEVADLMREIVL